MHNNCIYIGFIKISECRMARELIGLLRLLRLRDILRVTLASKEFKDTWENTFWREVIILENNEFWKYLFTLCQSLYAPQLIQLWGRRLMAMAGKVTQHDHAHPYSRLVTIVSLKV
jgi:hypothetical protein